MKKRNFILAVILFTIACFCFTTCDFDNPIMEKWWIDDDENAFQSITVVTIEYVLFAGSQSGYNVIAPASPGGTPLTPAQVTYNDKIIEMTAEMLKKNPEYLLLLHGHANPVDFNPQEEQELKDLSIARAKSTGNALREEFISIGGNVSDLAARMRETGYGGGLTHDTGASDNASVNRRVEVIIFTIDVYNK